MNEINVFVDRENVINKVVDSLMNEFASAKAWSDKIDNEVVVLLSNYKVDNGLVQEVMEEIADRLQKYDINYWVSYYDVDTYSITFDKPYTDIKGIDYRIWNSNLYHTIYTILKKSYAA